MPASSRVQALGPACLIRPRAFRLVQQQPHARGGELARLGQSVCAQGPAAKSVEDAKRYAGAQDLTEDEAGGQPEQGVRLSLRQPARPWKPQHLVAEFRGRDQVVAPLAQAITKRWRLFGSRPRYRRPRPCSLGRAVANVGRISHSQAALAASFAGMRRFASFWIRARSMSAPSHSGTLSAA